MVVDKGEPWVGAPSSTPGCGVGSEGGADLSGVRVKTGYVMVISQWSVPYQVWGWGVGTGTQCVGCIRFMWGWLFPKFVGVTPCGGCLLWNCFGPWWGLRGFILSRPPAPCGGCDGVFFLGGG